MVLTKGTPDYFNLVTPSGKAGINTTLLTSTDISANDGETNLLSVTGKGTVEYVLIGYKRKTTADDEQITNVRIYVDGEVTSSVLLQVEQFDAISMNNVFTSQRLGLVHYDEDNGKFCFWFAPELAYRTSFRITFTSSASAAANDVTVNGMIMYSDIGDV